MTNSRYKDNLNQVMGVLDFLFPNYSCLVCRAEMNSADKSSLICEECVSKLPVAENTCAKCGQRVGLHAKVCDRCTKNEWSFNKASSPFVYEGEIAELVLRLKYNAEGDISKAVAPFMVRTMEKSSMHADVIIPIPLTEKRFKSRGYNQAELIAKDISSLTRIPVETLAVVRIRQTEKQQDMTAKQRVENLKGAFSVPVRALVKGKNILLVDDVLTTGATANECARTLKKAGAENIFVLTVANTELKTKTK